MAKLASQHVVFTLSMAVSDAEEETIVVLKAEAIEQLKEAVVALAGDDGIVVEVVEG